MAEDRAITLAADRRGVARGAHRGPRGPATAPAGAEGERREGRSEDRPCEEVGEVEVRFTRQDRALAGMGLARAPLFLPTGDQVSSGGDRSFGGLRQSPGRTRITYLRDATELAP